MGKEHANTEYKRNRAIILSNKPDCAYCGRPADTVDHITAIMNGGGHELENLQACCAQCNNRKGHKEVAQRNQTVSHARAEAMRNHAIPIAKTEPFFSETRTFTPTQVFSIPTGPNQPALALVGHAQPRLETSRPEHAGSFAPQVREWAREYLGVELMEWQYTALVNCYMTPICSWSTVSAWYRLRASAERPLRSWHWLDGGLQRCPKYGERNKPCYPRVIDWIWR